MAQPLQIRFGTDADQAGRSIANLAGTVASNMTSVGSAVKGVVGNIDKLQGALNALPGVAAQALPPLLAVGGAIAVYAALSAAVSSAKDSVAEFVKIGTQAQQAGVSGSFLQRWQGEAKLVNLEVDKLTASLNRAREAATVSIGTQSPTPLTMPDVAASSPGGRRIQQNILAGNLNAGDAAAFNAADSQEARIRAVLDLIDKLKNESKSLAAFDLAKTWFGDDFERRLRDGVDMTGKMREALQSTAQTAGGKRIISDEEIQAAREINAQLVAIENTMASALAPIQRDLVQLGQDQYKGWLNIQQAIADAVAIVGKLYIGVKDVLAEIDKIAGKDPLGQLATNLGAQRVREFLGIKAPPSTEQYGPAIPPGFNDALAPKGDRSKDLPSLTKPAGGSSDTESKTALERYVDQLEKANKVAQAELDTVGKTNREREIAVGLAKAQAAAAQDVKDGNRDNAQLTAAEVANVTHLADVTQKAKDAALDLNQALRQNADTMRYFGQTAATALGDMIFDGAKFADVLTNIEKQLGRAALNALLTGTGPLAGLMGTSVPASAAVGTGGGLFGMLGSIFKPGTNAEGTGNWPGGWTWVGEKGPELIRLPSGSQVVPNGQSNAMAGGGPMQVNIINPPAPVQAKEVSDGRGGRRLDIAFADTVGGSLGSPQVRGALSAGYGLRPRLTSRGM